jgi:hypothetical protein
MADSSVIGRSEYLLKLSSNRFIQKFIYKLDVLVTEATRPLYRLILWEMIAYQPGKVLLVSSTSAGDRIIVFVDFWKDLFRVN